MTAKPGKALVDCDTLLSDCDVRALAKAIHLPEIEARALYAVVAWFRLQGRPTECSLRRASALLTCSELRLQPTVGARVVDGYRELMQRVELKVMD